MSKTILLIDDDDLIRNLVKRFLEQGGYSVITAPGGKTGLEKYRADKPDLVIIDVAMPEMNGFDVAKNIRIIQRRENRPHTPIILLTAYARSFFIAAGSDAEVDSYLTKPITPESLLDHVGRFLNPVLPADLAPASPAVPAEPQPAPEVPPAPPVTPSGAAE